MTAPEHIAKRDQRDTARVPLRVLVVEDSEGDTLLLLHELKRGGYKPVHERVETQEAMEEALSRESWDVVVSDYYMPRFTAPDALALLRERGFDVPFIIVSGRMGEDVAVEAMKAGAYDYIMKDNMTRLCATVGRGLKEAEERRERRLAEERLRESEERFDLAVRGADDGLWDWNIEGGTVYFSPRWKSILGYEDHEIPNRFEEWEKRVHPEDLERAQKAIQEHLDGRTPYYELEHRMLHKDGRYRWIRARGTSVQDASGKPRRMAGAHWDVTERKQAEEALKVSEASYRAIFDSSNDAIFVHDLETGAILDVNQKACAVLGYSRKELCQLSIEDFSAGEPPYTMEDALSYIRRAAGGETQVFEWLSKKRSGESFWSEVTLNRATIGGQERLLANVRDITERKEAEEALRRAHDELEARVLERTVELIGANATLEAEVAERKQAEEALQRSEEHFRSLIENASDIITILGPQGIIRYQSPAAERITGRSEAEMVGTNAFDYLYPDDIAHTVAALTEVVNNPGTTRLVEYRWQHKDGYYISLESVGSTLRSDSASSGVVVNTRDITERKRAEDELRFQKTLLEAQSEASIDGILVVSAEGKIISFNRRFVEMWGIPEEVVASRSDEAALQTVLDKLVDPEEFLARVSYLYEHLGEESRDEILLKDGRTFDRYSAPVRGKDDTDYGRVWYFRDVTDHKQAEAALREGEERLRFALETGGMGAWEWDIGSGKILWSPTLEAIHGRGSGSFGGTFEEVLAEVHPDDRELLAGAIRSTLEGQGGHDVEYRIVWPDGSVHWLAAKGRVVRDENGEPLRMVGVCADITPRKQGEEALRSAKEEAERAREEAETANRAKSEFLSRMSHELRTPMNSILGFAQLLARKPLPPDQRRSVDHILKGGRHLLQLINEVLDIARIETNRQQLSLEPVHIGAILQETLSLIQPLADQHDCRIEDSPVADSDYYVLADRQRLTQVLLNLLSNAVKYNRLGGSIHLSCEKTLDEAERQHGAERLWIRVHDTGPGVAPEQMEQLFVPFDRLGAEQSDVEGTGLGLALSKRLVEAMGGVMTVESVVGEGSTFAVALSLVESPLERLERSEQAEPAEDAASEETGTLLYIEDNLANLGLIESILSERPGVTLLSALQGRIGLDLASQHCPDLILLDLHLPDMGGDEVLRRLRSQPRTRDIPVIIISADATPGRIERLMQSGASGYLTKPLDVEQFLDTIDEALIEK